MGVIIRKGIKLVRLAVSTLRRCLLLLLAIGGNFFYQYTISSNFYLALILGVMGGVLIWFSLVIRLEEIAIFQNQLKELNKYASGVVFKLKAGKNVLEALRETQAQLGVGIDKEVMETIYLLDETQSVQTDHFLKYDFPALNIFHQTLSIKYVYGGNAGDLFHQILKDMAFEIKKRDELFRRKKYSAMQVMTMVLLVAGLPICLHFTASSVYSIFQEIAISQPLLFLFHTMLLWLIYALQKEKCDISIRL